MSNIQITENGPGKYSPEWFYSESQTPEWISFAHKADELRENFINLFGIERLKSLSGKDLLTSLFYNDEGTKTNLCYRLEMDKDIREVFGSISGGAAYKFGLFYHKKNQSWTCGSPLKPVLLTEDEAIQKAEEMRNDLVEGAEIISSFGPLDSEEDYEQLYKQLEHIPGINMVWRMKYYQMLFPTLFAPFYGQDIQLRVLHFLNQKPSDIPYLIYNGLLQTQNDGTTKIMDFFDEQRMCRLYEKFLLEYYRKEHPELSANASQIAWQLDDSENQLLPKMQTDIMLSQGNNILIIDAKYYSHMTQQQYGTNTLHSNNLYQIFTYVKNKEFELRKLEHTVSGMLLYAQTDEYIIPNNTYQMSGNQISVRALNLNQDFSGIAHTLDDIIQNSFNN